MESYSKSVPDAIQRFLAVLAEMAPEARPRVERGDGQAGGWWIDVPGENSVVVEWWPRLGFGLAIGEGWGDGEGPSEIVGTPERAARRVAQFLAQGRVKPPTGLRALRELYETTQEEIAAKLGVNQEAVSRLEGRADCRIETIGKYVKALGGHMEIRAVFPDGRLCIYPPPTPARRGSEELSRWVADESIERRAARGDKEKFTAALGNVPVVTSAEDDVI